MTPLSILGLFLLPLLGLAWFCPEIAEWCARVLHTRAAGLRAARQAQGRIREIHRALERRRNRGA